MGYKLIAIDMDDTLLTHDKKISEGNIKALRLAHEKGIHIVISTGRIYASAYSYSEVLGFKPFIIASNGAIIRDPDNRKLYESVMDMNEIVQLIRISERYNTYYHFYSDTTVYTPEVSNKYEKYAEWNKLFSSFLKVDVKEIENPLVNVYKLNTAIVKYVIFNDDNNLIKIIRDDLGVKSNLNITSSYFNNIEIINKGVNKGNALKILGEYYNIDRSEMIAVGDSENDLEMVKYAGLGVAVDNAIDLLKNNADFITKSNMDNGVAYVIEKYIL
jgi:hypothetical protein